MDVLVKRNIVDGTEWKAARNRHAEASKARAAVVAANPPPVKKK